MRIDEYDVYDPISDLSDDAGGGSWSYWKRVDGIDEETAKEIANSHYRDYQSLAHAIRHDTGDARDLVFDGEADRNQNYGTVVDSLTAHSLSG